MTAHTSAKLYLPSLQTRQYQGRSDYPLLQVRTDGAKRRASSEDSKGQAKIQKTNPARSGSPPGSPPHQQQRSGGGNSSPKSGSAKDKSPSPYEFSTYSTTSSDLETAGYTNTVKATIRGPGTLSMKPGANSAIVVDNDSRLTQKVRAPVVKTKVSPKTAEHQSSFSQVVAKGNRVKATVQPESGSGILEAWGTEGQQRMTVLPGQKRTMIANAVLNEYGDPARRARIKTTLPDGGKIRAKAGPIPGLGPDTSSDTDSSQA